MRACVCAYVRVCVCVRAGGVRVCVQCICVHCVSTYERTYVAYRRRSRDGAAERRRIEERKGGKGFDWLWGRKKGFDWLLRGREKNLLPWQSGAVCSHRETLAQWMPL